MQHEQADMLVAKQYDLVKSARDVLITYCETFLHVDYLKELALFQQKSIRDMQVHIANIYIHWLGRFAMNADIPYLEEKEIGSAFAMRGRFDVLDQLVYRFMQAFGEQWQDPFTKTIPGDTGQLTTTPLTVFTHVITHEFHHKGQLLTMGRLLGYTPPDTDIIRF